MISLTIASKLVNMARPSSKTDQHSRVAWRSSVTMFVNSTIVVVLANYFTVGSQLKVQLWTPKGLATDLWMMMIFTILDPFIALFDLQILYKCFKRSSLSRHPERYIQKEANHIMEAPEFVVSERISKYFYCLMHSLFILPLFPAASAVAVAYIVIFYWMDKLWLTKVCLVPNKISMKLILQFAHFFDVIMICYTVCSSLL